MLLVFAKGCAQQALTSMKRDIVRIAWLVSLKASLHVYTEPFGDWTFSGFLARNAMMSWAVQSNPSNFCSQNWSLPLLSNSVCHSRKNVGIGNIKFMVRHYITHHTLFHLLGLCLCIFTVTCKTHYKASIWQRRRLKLIHISQGELMSWDTNKVRPLNSQSTGSPLYQTAVNRFNSNNSSSSVLRDLSAS